MTNPPFDLSQFVNKLPPFAGSDDVAKELFDATRGEDPFPDIPSALLNSADLLEYVARTGMVHPFTVDEHDPSEVLKPASCGIKLEGTCIYWDTDDQGNPKEVEQTIKSGDELILKKNSIVYVTLQPMFRLPDYIAARFNLTIRDIYRGILVGTGPLVDPGFTGKLSLPLHNLTYNDYRLKGGEPLVWMEFTKLSPNQRWNQSWKEDGRTAEYMVFPSRKNKRKAVRDYLEYAHSGPITSSIPPLTEKASAAAEKAQAAVRRQQFWFSGLSALGAVILIASIAAMVIAVFSLVDSSNADRSQLAHEVDGLKHKVAKLEHHDRSNDRSGGTAEGNEK